MTEYDMEDEADTPEDEDEAASLVSVEQLQRLIRLLDRSDVSELELKLAGDGTRLVLRKAKATDGMGAVAAPSLVASAESGSATEAAAAAVETKKAIVAPLVGLFHPWAKPRGKALVAVGDRIKVGQLVATIESLNVINEVESTVAGRIVEIVVQDGQPVEYGQPLMTVESDSGGA